MGDVAMGTLNWCGTSGGRLSEREKVTIARNVARMQAEMMFDEFRTRLGLLHPKAVDIDAFAPPETSLVRDADELAKEFYDETVWKHCVRSYYFGALVAAHDGIAFDREIFYAAAICHDLGVNQEKVKPVYSCCFAHSGGLKTRDHLHAKGHAINTAQSVGDAISTHMNLFVPLGDYPAESTLTAIGATCDMFGAYVRRINPVTLAAVVERWPRAGLMSVLGPFATIPHLEDSRMSVIREMGVFEGKGEHPIEAVLAQR